MKVLNYKTGHTGPLKKPETGLLGVKSKRGNCTLMSTLKYNLKPTQVANLKFTANSVKENVKET